MKKFLTLLYFLSFMPFIFSQQINGHYHGRQISFPNIPGFITLVADFHMHTVLSDGEVWPSIRVEEAIRDGLDAIAVTDHIEYQPHQHDIPHTDRNRPYQIASSRAENRALIVINGAEVTRNMPPGHANAIFLEDVNKLNVKDSIKAFKEAKKQGAFIFWNHPHWEAQYTDGIAKLTELHKKLIKKGMLNGIEVVNDVTYSDEALQIALDYDLTIMGNSDIHGLVDWQYDLPSGGHRPVTLVFAKEKSAESLKEALFKKRTVVFFNDMLIGRSEFLVPLLTESIIAENANYVETWSGTTSIAKLQLWNKSDAPLILKNTGEFDFHNQGQIITLAKNTSMELQLKTLEKLEEFELKFEVLNAVTAPKKHPDITITVFVNQE